MNLVLLKKNLSIIIVLLFILTSISVAAEKTNIDYLNKNIQNEDLKYEVDNVLNNNSSGRYLILSAGLRASSYFVKLPRIFTQRGMFFSGEIWYRSNFALTLVFQRNNSKFKLVNFERGTHRLFIVGIGHSTFSRPHWFSFGRVTAYTKLRPVII